MGIFRGETRRFLPGVLAIVLIHGIPPARSDDTPVLGDLAYATGVTGFSPGADTQAPYNSPAQALGAPNYVEGDPPEYVALGREGTLILHFANAFLSASGSSRPDIAVFEVGSSPEGTNLFVSTDGSQWISASADLDASAEIQPGDQFQYVKLVDSGNNPSGAPYAGADIDAVALLTAGEVCQAGSPPDCGVIQCQCNEDYVDGRCVAKTVVNRKVFVGSTLLNYPYDRNNQGRICPAVLIGKEERTDSQCSTPAAESDALREGNPVCVTTGAKEHYENLFDGSALGLPDVVARYTSDWKKNPSQTYWTSSFDGRVSAAATDDGVVSAYRYQRGHVSLYFGKNGTEWSGNQSGERWLFTASGSDLVITRPNGATEIYRSGKLVEEISPSGEKTTYTWSGNKFVARSAYGKSIAVEMDGAFRIKKFTDPGGAVYVLNYVNYQLSEIVYPDETPETDADNPRKTFLYEDSRFPKFLTGLIDENGKRQTRYTYNDSKQVVQEEWPGAGRRMTFEYFPRDEASWSGEDEIEDFIPPMERARMSVYDGGNLKRVYEKRFARRSGVDFVAEQSTQYCEGCASATESRTYDDEGLLREVIDGNGVRDQYSYDDDGRVIERISAAGTSVSKQELFNWSDDGQLTDRVVGDLAEHFTYNTGRKPTQIARTAISSGQTSITELSYTTNGLMQQVDGPRTDVADSTTYTYDAAGNVSAMTNALGHTVVLANHDGSGRVGTITDPNGLVTTLTYAPRGWLKTLVSGGMTTTFTYDNAGQLTKLTMPDGSFFEYAYDDAHRLVAITDTPGERIEYTVDYAGNRIREEIKNTAGEVVFERTSVFDALNRLRQELDAANGVIADYTYDANGNQTGVDAPLDRDRISEYDALDRLVRVTGSLNHVTQYAYDANDNFVSVTDPRNTSTSYQYNGLGQLMQRVSPDTGITTYTYDTAGNLGTRTDARGKTGTYSYDALNRVTAISYPDQTISYTYDQGDNALGRLTSVVDNSGSTSWTYDLYGRVTSREQAMGSISKTVQYGYNAVGQLASLTLPSGNVIQYGYLHGKITSVTLNGSTVLLSNVLYQPFGPTRGWTWGNGTLHVREYDTDGRITHLDSAGLKTFSYDEAFRITGITDSTNAALSRTYGYDPLDRLTSAVGATSNQGWTYDANGNRLGESGSAPSTYTISGSSNRITAVTGALNRTYTHDAAGNITSDGTLSFSYDDAGRMVSAVTAGGNATYVLNALGQRVKKTAPGGTTWFVYDEAGHLLGEYNGSGVIKQEIIWLDDIPVAVLRRDASGNYNPYYIHTDHLNTPRQISRSNNNVVRWRWDADPFGVGAADADPDGDTFQFVFNLRFPGQYYDAETGLNYNYFRDYDPATERYVESDPIGIFGGLNTYTYVNSNPINFTDRFGLAKDSITAAIESAVIRGDTRALQGLIEGGGLNTVQQAAAEAGLRSIGIVSRTTNSTSRVAQLLGKKEKQVRQAIERCKQDNLPRNGPIKNPNVRIDPQTGEVFPELQNGGIGDSIGNIFEYLL